MILGAIIKFIKNFLDGFAAVCAFLLIKLKLWISAVFALLFIVVCAFSGIELKGKTVNYFIGGIVACFALAVVLNVLSYYRRSAPKQANTRPSAAPKKLRDSEEFEYNNGLNYYAQSEPEEITEDKKYNYTSYTESEADKQAHAVSRLSELNSSKRRYDDFADLKKKYFEQNGTDSEKEPQASRSNIRPQTEQRAEPIQSVAYMPREMREQTETPMVFAMRNDPDILIYEYSDKLVFYRKTKRGLLMEKVELKS